MIVNKNIRINFIKDLNSEIQKRKCLYFFDLVSKIAHGILIFPLFSNTYRQSVTAAYDRLKNAKHLTQDIVKKVNIASLLQRKTRYDALVKKALHKNPALYRELKERPLMGRVEWIPANFGLWMPGIKLAASYLKEKHKIKNLLVCQTESEFQNGLKAFAESQTKGKAVFIVSTLGGKVPDTENGNFPQHKFSVGVENTGKGLSIILLDGMPVPIGTGRDAPGDKIVNAIAKLNLPEIDLYELPVQRQKYFGCETLSLRDALFFLRRDDFFSELKANKKQVCNKMNIWTATSSLPPEFMVGTQSKEALNDYLNQAKLDEPFPLKGDKTLSSALNGKKWLTVNGEPQNHYITFKLLKYLDIALSQLNTRIQ